jgi:hypothetical protein
VESLADGAATVLLRHALTYVGAREGGPPERRHRILPRIAAEEARRMAGKIGAD